MEEEGQKEVENVTKSPKSGVTIAKKVANIVLDVVARVVYDDGYRQREKGQRRYGYDFRVSTSFRSVGVDGKMRLHRRKQVQGKKHKSQVVRVYQDRPY